MKIKALACVAALAFASSAWAGKEGSATGTVNKVKADSEALNITHGPIKGLGMDGMTMDFNVMDPSMLEEVAAGDKIEFNVEEAAGGRYVITDVKVIGKGKVAADDGHNHSH